MLLCVSFRLLSYLSLSTIQTNTIAQAQVQLISTQDGDCSREGEMGDSKTYLRITRMRRMTRILRLLRYARGIKLLLRIGIISRINIYQEGCPFCYKRKYAIPAQSNIQLNLKFSLGIDEAFRLKIDDESLVLMRLLTGSCAMIDWNCGPESIFEACWNSSSVRMVERERLICAGSGILISIESREYRDLVIHLSKGR